MTTNQIICMEEGKYYKHTNTYKRDIISNTLVCAAAAAMLVIIGLIQYSAIVLVDDE